MTREEMAALAEAESKLPLMTLECPRCGFTFSGIRECMADLFDRLGKRCRCGTAMGEVIVDRTERT